MKSKLLSLMLLYTVAFYGLSQQEMDDIALKIESVVTQYDYDKPTGEMKIRRKLKEDYPDLSKDDAEAIRKIIVDLKKNPLLRNKLENKDSQVAPSNDTGLSDDSSIGVSDQDILKLAREAKPVWDKNGNMGEFAARKFLRDEKGITSKKIIDDIITKIIELKSSKGPSPRPRQPKDGSGSEQPVNVRVPADVEEWAQKFKNFDPQTQRFNLIKAFNANNVDKVLWNQIMIRINTLRSEPSFVPSDSGASQGSTEATGSGVDTGTATSSVPSSEPSSGVEKKEQSFYDLEQRPEMQRIVSLFANNERAVTQFIQIMKFKINNSMNMLWQDLVAYFYFTTLERPSDQREQILYDWILKHGMNDIYKLNEV